MPTTTREAWRAEIIHEIERIRTILTDLGYTLDEDQPNIKGDRYLLGGGNKLVLNARRGTERVVIKASASESGIREINEEKRVRDALSKLSFAADSLKVPPEIWYGTKHGYTILILSYIEQKEVLASKSLEEKFFMVLRALEAQEAFHATTYEHVQEVKPYIPIFSVDDYIRSVRDFKRDTAHIPGVAEIMDRVAARLESTRPVLERYNNYVAHFDFVPHNIRVDGHTIWILDLTNMRLGNKYESWARLINYMLVHDQPLAGALLQYVRDDRGADEAEALHSMRAFKAALLIAYYARILPKTAGNSNELIKLRIALWMDVTRKLLEHAPFPEANAAAYIEARDKLVSAEEKERKKSYDII